MTYSFKGIKMDTPHDALALKRIYKELKDHPKAHARMPSLLHVLDQEAEDEAKENMKKEAVW
ncbi:hypothetical protein [uncultured Cohaesibacter sp.]|uniref:hypothetical protein n=1 Tax=uncultured Cohaesibacter sp. TaxID=1002546 RepID=UPI002AA900E1|nr:hypothetical protein [uncultured Cohaesibacter sp.]